MTLPLYTDIYREAQNRPGYYSVSPDKAISALQEHSYPSGTYLISPGEGFCEYLFTFVHLDRKIYQLIAKLILKESTFCWSFNNTTFPTINHLVLNSKLYGYCFLLIAYTPLLKTAEVANIEKRPEYYNVHPDRAKGKLQDYPYLPGTYLISPGEGFCEHIFTFVQLDRTICQLAAKWRGDYSRGWSFNNATYPTINQLILSSKINGYCFLLYAYTPLLKIDGFVPLALAHEAAFNLAKEGEDGDYFIVNNADKGRSAIRIVRYSKERNECDIYSYNANENTLKIPGGVKIKRRLKRPVCLLGLPNEKDNLAIKNLSRLTNVS